MKIETLEATPSCRAITVEFLDLADLQGLMAEHGEKILDLVHSQILAHNFRGQHRATDKTGKLLKAEDHIYKMGDFIQGMTAGARSGEPSKEDVEMSKRLGKAIAAQTVTQERIAEARCKIDMARLLTLKAAWMMDVAGNKVARSEIAMIKVVAPNMSCKVVDWAIQAHGGGGVSQDFWLAEAYAHQRTVRLVDGPDEVHRNAIAKIEHASRVLDISFTEAAISTGFATQEDVDYAQNTLNQVPREQVSRARPAPELAAPQLRGFSPHAAVQLTAGGQPGVAWRPAKALAEPLDHAKDAECGDR